MTEHTEVLPSLTPGLVAADEVPLTGWEMDLLAEPHEGDDIEGEEFVVEASDFFPDFVDDGKAPGTTILARDGWRDTSNPNSQEWPKYTEQEMDLDGNWSTKVRAF